MKAVIFDLDGVVVSTNELHYRAWKTIAESENLPFDRTINNRLRGVSRLRSLEIIIQNAHKDCTQKDKEALAERKNAIYREYLSELDPYCILEGVQELIEGLKEKGVRLGLASSSKNARLILKKIGLAERFDAITDGNDIERSKPDPEVFLKTSRKLNINPRECLVIEDAPAGIDAAIAAGMMSLAVGSAKECSDADMSVESLSQIDVQSITELKATR